MSSRYRVVVWGTGGVGKACLKEAMRLKEIEVVGVLVYDPAKTRGDIGDIVGLPPYGLRATTSREEVFSTQPDCILYAPRDFGDFRSDEEIIDLLKRGHNVITSMPYQNIHVRDPQVRVSIENACRNGGSVFHAAGVNPGFIVERLAMTATGATNAITQVKVEEFVRIGTEPQDTLNAFGFGIPVDESGRKSPAAVIAEQYERQFIHYMGDAFGTPVVELKYSVTHHLAPRDLPAPTMTIPKGTVAYLSHRWEGITRDGPNIIFIVYWYMTDEVKPDNVPCEDFYLVTIEGRPSVRLAVELRASFEPESRTYPGDPTVPVFYVTAVTMIQAIPGVLAAKPGIKEIERPSNSYWKADMRK